MKTLNKEEAIKAMANGEVVEEVITTSVGDARRYKFHFDGVILVSKVHDGVIYWNRSLGLDSDQYQTVKEKKRSTGFGATPKPARFVSI